MVFLIPTPKQATFGTRTFSWNAIDEILLPSNYGRPLLLAALTLADDFQSLTGKRIRFVGGEAIGLAIRLEPCAKIKGTEAYRLQSDANGILVQAATERGLFYGVQTLRQMLRQGDTQYPEFNIQDSPDYPVRGFYHDATRGAIPTLETLFQLVDKMALYKLNHLELYVEHTFALARHTDIWEGADPLTAEEILRLQDYCEERNVELVPSIATFGHCYMAMRSKRLRDLNEMDADISEWPFSFRDRMQHATLNPSDPRSFQLVADIIGEYLPLFKSKYFNICCDETFDLGRGKNKHLVKSEEDIQKLYVSFMKKIMALVTRQGKIPMFWGDVIGDNSELLKELPKDIIPIEWDYGPDADRRDTAKLAAATPNFWIAPGTGCWSRWLTPIHNAQKNILNYAKKGLKYGAKGFLNTNWGDRGNVNLPAISWHGFAYGAACGWNTAAAEDIDAFNKALDLLEFGAKGFCDAWMKFEKLTTTAWGHVAQWVDPTTECSFESEYAESIDFKATRKAVSALEKAFVKFDACLATAHPQDPYAREELRFGAEMTILMHKVIATIKYPGDKAANWKLADEIRKKEVQFCQLWHRRNKPSEYYRVKGALLDVARKLDTLS